MKYLTLDYIKQHSRIDFDCEDSVLELYGTAAEDTVMNLCRRKYEDFLAEYGQMPAAVIQATLLLVDNSYNHRSPVSPQSLSNVGYSFDILLKPYMRL
jgi:uncharacterized phage protein (predicted DNA packaging)